MPPLSEGDLSSVVELLDSGPATLAELRERWLSTHGPKPMLASWLRGALNELSMRCHVFVFVNGGELYWSKSEESE